jgi:hypothetical protein
MGKNRANVKIIRLCKLQFLYPKQAKHLRDLISGAVSTACIINKAPSCQVFLVTGEFSVPETPSPRQ